MYRAFPHRDFHKADGPKISQMYVTVEGKLSDITFINTCQLVKVSPISNATDLQRDYTLYGRVTVQLEERSLQLDDEFTLV
jgi:hypothetical protein